MKTISASLFCFIAVNLLAQNWCPPGAEWTYNYYDWGTEGYVRISLSKDTVIAGQLCQKLDVKNRTWAGSPYFIYDTSYRAPIYTFSRNDTVFIYQSWIPAFVPLYCFSARIGDTIQYSNPNSLCGNPINLLVDSTGVISINNNPLKYYVAHALPNDGVLNLYGEEIKVLERLGVWTGYFFMPTFVCYTDAPSYSLRCYKDDSFSVYQADALKACDYFYNSLDEIQNEQGLIVYPNPASSNIKFNNHENLEYCISNPIGQVLLKGIAEAEQPININMLPDGLYVICVKNGTSSCTKSFVKKERQH